MDSPSPRSPATNSKQEVIGQVLPSFDGNAMASSVASSSTSSPDSASLSNASTDPINARTRPIPNLPEHEPISRRQPQRKRRRRLKRADGDDDEAEGLVLPLTYVGSSAFDASYTLPLLIGSTRQRMFVQIDSGSADLWVASTSCSDASCPSARRRSLSPPSYKTPFSPFTAPPRNPSSSHPHAPVKRGSSPLYNPSASVTRIETGAPITITYLVGSMQGIVVWDSVGLDLSNSVQGEDDNDADDSGTFPWTISSQAFAAASALTSEPLRPNFSGVLGLSPPLNSLIARIIPATDGGDGSTVDGASWVSNVWSSSGTPPLEEKNWYIRLLLHRPDGGVLSPPTPIMALGMEPSADSYPPFWDGKLGNMSYTRPLASLDPTTDQVIGTTLWRVGLTALSVGGKPITLTSVSPSAILDSGVPTILASKAVADGIYGAVGVGPGGDGNYYLSCSTQISLNVTLKMNLGGGDVVFPVHPLDLTERRGGKDECMGTVQASAGITDDEIVLGVAFLRSVDTILGYDGRVGVNGNGGSGGVKLGLRSLIDIATADSEWHQVRVDGHALGGSTGSGGTGNSGKTSSGGGGISKVGVVALAVIGSLAGFCILMFLVWRWVSVRRERRERGDYATTALGSPTTPHFPNEPPPVEDKTYLFGLIKRRNRRQKDGDAFPMREMSEDEKRQKRFEEYMARQRKSEYSDFGNGIGTGHDKDRTLVASGSTFNKDLALFGEDKDKVGQEVVYNGYGKEDPWDPSTGLDWGGRVGERDVLLSTEGAETRGEKVPEKVVGKEDST